MVIKYRGVWMLFHRWVGIVIGVVIAILGITGSLLVFEDEIDTALYPKLDRKSVV